MSHIVPTILVSEVTSTSVAPLLAAPNIINVSKPILVAVAGSVIVKLPAELPSTTMVLPWSAVVKVTSAVTVFIAAFEPPI